MKHGHAGYDTNGLGPSGHRAWISIIWSSAMGKPHMKTKTESDSKD